MNDCPQRQLVAAFFDGNAIYLWPDELKELGKRSGTILRPRSSHSRNDRLVRPSSRSGPMMKQHRSQSSNRATAG
jgi:hypothetical protein